MLWYKSWLETRWRFLIGLALLICSAAGGVFLYPPVVKLTATLPVPNLGGRLGEKIREAMSLAQSFNGFIWTNWFRQNLTQMGTLFAILLGTASLMSESSGALFTFSLPVTRQRLMHVRAMTGLAELFAIILIPTMLIPLLAPAIRQRYGVGSALVHVICFFVGASLFFALALLLSTIFNDVWRPVMIAVAIAVVVALADQLFEIRILGVFRVMNGERWFRDGQLPWPGLIATAVVSASIYYAAVRNLVRRDF